MRITIMIKAMAVQNLKRFAYFKDRQEMRVGHPTHRYRDYDGYHKVALPSPPPLPYDWTKGNSLAFPMDDNGGPQGVGDCFVAAAEHQDNAWTGNIGTQSVFQDAATLAWYTKLSGGDNGLNEQQIVSGWKAGLPGIAAATILDVLDIDPTNASLLQSGMWYWEGVQFQLAMPEAWANNFQTGYICTSGHGIAADQANGHAVYMSGILANGNVEFETWDTYGYFTAAGIALCDPSAFVCFSTRQFNSQGYDAKNRHISVMAPLWVQCGGNNVVLKAVSLYPPPVGPTPVPTPAPVPVGGVLTPGNYSLKSGSSYSFTT